MMQEKLNQFNGILDELRSSVKCDKEKTKKVETIQLVFLCALDIAKNPLEMEKAINTLVGKLKELSQLVKPDFKKGGIVVAQENENLLVSLRNRGEFIISNTDGKRF